MPWTRETLKAKGTRYSTLAMANSFWVTYQARMHRPPFLLYEFPNQGIAILAFLELGCFRITADSKNLISTEVIDFGMYQNESGKFEAWICGDDLTHKLWQGAKALFAKHGGVYRGDSLIRGNSTF